MGWFQPFCQQFCHKSWWFWSVWSIQLISSDMLIYVLIYPLVNIQKNYGKSPFLYGKTQYKWTIWSIHPSQSKANASLLPFFQICWSTDALGARCIQLAAPWGWNPGHPSVMMGWQSPFIGYSSKRIHVSSTAHINPKSYKIYLEYSTADCKR